MRRGELLERTLASTRQPDAAAATETSRRLDAKTKPPGSLGRLEELAVRLAAIRGGVPVRPLTPAIVVAAALVMNPSITIASPRSRLLPARSRPRA